MRNNDLDGDEQEAQDRRDDREEQRGDDRYEEWLDDEMGVMDVVADGVMRDMNKI